MKKPIHPTTLYLRITVALLLAILAAITFGCATIAEKVADHMTVRSLEHEHDITLFEGDLAAYRSCLHHRGGTCTGNAVTALAATLTSTGTPATSTTQTTPAKSAVDPAVAKSVDQLPTGNPAKMAKDVLGHPALQNSVDLHNYLRGHGSGDLKVEQGAETACSRIHLPVSISQIQDLHDKIHRATAAGGWKALQEHTAKLLEESKEGDPDHEAKAREAHKAHFIKTYIDAFFADGHILEVDLEINAADAQADIEKKLGKHTENACQVYNAQAALGTGATSDPADASATASATTDCSALAASIYKSVLHTRGNVDKKLVKVGQRGFVSRDGTFAAQIPSVAVDIDPTAPHLVTFHASPAKPNGKFDWTALGTDLTRVVLEAVFDAHEGLPAVTSPTASGAKLLPAIPADMSSHLDAMTEVNNTAEITTGIVVDRIIKGIGPLSLNNDAIEQMITTMVTASVRKAVEKSSWCWYACGLDKDVKTLADDAKADAKAAAKKDVKKVEDAAKRKAKHVCLLMHVQK